MRRLFTVLLVLLLVPAGLFAKDVDFDTLKGDIELFAEGVASSLPLNSAVGLNWSDAYIGQFPHFGVGLTVGASTIPFEAAKIVLDTLDLTDQITGDPQLSRIAEIGMPLPAYTVEARLGGIILPFDAGVKVGILPPDFNAGALVEGLSLDYTNLGFDVRVPLLEERGLIPELSVGGGYNYLRANFGFAGILGENLNIQSFDDPRPDVTKTYNVTMEDPSVNFQWSANVIDLKAQVSKKLLLFRPYAGFGASVGFGSAGSGFESELQGITETEINEINAWAAEEDMEAPLPELSDSSFYVNASMGSGWAFRAFGGMSIELLILKIDITGMYDFLGNNFGVTLGTRIQL
jgi:hypothetical protein